MATTQTTSIGFLPYTKGEADILLNAKAPISSPTFTDVPAAPTAAPGTNTTQLATTAFVQAAVGAVPSKLPVSTKTADFNAAVNNAYLCNESGGVCIATLPATAAVGDIIQLFGLGAGLFQALANSGQTIQAFNLVTKTAGYVQADLQYGFLELRCIVADTTWEVTAAGGTITVETS